VVARAGDAGERQLVAHVVPAPGATLSIDGLARALRERLPEPMVPGAWCVAEALPRTAGGKIDRRALAEVAPAPASLHAAAHPASAGAAAAADGTLATVLSIVAELLPEAPAGADDDLIRVGMHSVLILRFVALCRQRLGATLKVREVYRLATPAAIAARIDALAGATP